MSVCNEQLHQVGCVITADLGKLGTGCLVSRSGTHAVSSSARDVFSQHHLRPSRKNLELALEMLLQEGMIPLTVRLPTGFIFSIPHVYLPH